MGVNVYGRSPSILREIRKSIKDAKRAAHLCPPGLIGRRSCCVKRARSQPCKVKRRLFSHRLVGEGKRSQGRVRARAISGIPR